MTVSFENRTNVWTRLKSEEFDLCVIGGGITGAGIARDAALRGLKVALIEKDDFGHGTSSRSSKLIHGGLRYLEHYKLGLVKESLRERIVLMNIAPHLVHPLPFLIPIYKGEKPPALLMRLGLIVYDLLSIGKRVGSHKWYNAKKFKEANLEPKIRMDGLKGVGRYYDCQMNDARLTLENILSACEFGAAILNYVQVIRFHTIDHKLSAVTVQDLETDEEIKIRAKIFVNATGPWADLVDKLDDSQAYKKIANSKGVHFLIKRKIGDHAVVVTMRDGRVVFVLPYGSDYNMIGTTDTFYQGDIDQILCTSEDIDYLIEGFNQIFPSFPISRNDVISTYAGVRPLVFDPEIGASASDVSREHKIFTSTTGLITIIGGKFTTYRKMGKTITDLTVKQLKQQKRLPECIKKCQTHDFPLYGGKIDNYNKFLEKESKLLVEDQYQLSKKSIIHLLSFYGSKTKEVLAVASESLDWLKPILPNLPYLKVQVIYSIRNEIARSLEDFFWRRTFMALECNILDCLDEVAILFKNELYWDEIKVNEEKLKVISLYKKITMK